MPSSSVSPTVSGRPSFAATRRASVSRPSIHAASSAETSVSRRPEASRYVKRPHAERRPDALAVVKQPVRVCFPKGQKPQLRRYRRGADQQRRGQHGDKPPPHAATGCRRVRQRGKHLREPGTSFGRTFPCGQHAHGAVKCSVIHRQSPSFSRISFKRRRPRLRREAAVPRGTPSTAAISSSG